MLDDEVLWDILAPLHLEIEALDGDERTEFLNRILEMVQFGKPS